MKQFIVLVGAALLTATVSVPAGAAGDTAIGVTCSDGTASPQAGKGACSHHGGIAKKGTGASATGSTATTTQATEPTRAATAAPAGTVGKDTASTAAATAKCKDGTMSHAKTHSGACSKHGGVAQWLDK